MLEGIFCALHQREKPLKYCGRLWQWVLNISDPNTVVGPWWIIPWMEDVLNGGVFFGIFGISVLFLCVKLGN